MTRREHLLLMREDCLKTIHEIMRSGQSVEIEGMKITRPDLAKTRAMLNDIDNELAQLSKEGAKKSRPRLRVIVPV